MEKLFRENKTSHLLKTPEKDFHPSGISDLRAGTQPPSCNNLDNRLHILPDSHMKSLERAGGLTSS